MKVFIVTSLILFLFCKCSNNNKIRREIISKANTEMCELVDNTINAQSGGLGSILIDQLITQEKKQEYINENILPRFRKFVENTKNKDSLNKMNTDAMFRYKMVVKSTIGNASEEALKSLYEKIINIDFKSKIN